MTGRYRYSDAERAVLEQSAVPFAIYQFVDKRVATLVLSDGFLDLFGYDSREEAHLVAETDMYRDTHPDDVARIADVAYRFATEDIKYDVIYRSKNPRGPGYNVLHAVGKHVFMPDGARVTHVSYTNEGPYVEGLNGPENAAPNRLLSKAVREESILKASYYDHLTGLPNMNCFFELAEAGRVEMLSRGQKPALLFIDLAGMKYYNRKYGFAEGNKLLYGFARLLVRYFSLDHCGRFGGDHFVAFTQEEGHEALVNGLMADAGRLNGGVSLPVHVGVYFDSMEAVDASTACDRAKVACDALRSAYSSRVNYFSRDLRDDVQLRQYIVANLERALREKWIVVYYQPIIRAVSGKVCEEETLARWADPVYGVLPPSAFVSFLEDAGLIWKLDLYVLDRVLEKLKAQDRAGLYLVPQSVNLSRTDFDSCDIVEEIRNRVDAAGIGRDKITIEITENVIGRDFDFMKAQIQRFSDLGFPVWIDDFGSGYSSLDLLQSVKFNLIKFDIRFMEQFDRTENSRIVLTELMKLASALDTDTVCEGVETEEQARFLQEIGCTRLQGYYYQNPIPWEKVLEKYENGAQIGFEDPREAAYYEAIGRVNLYDLAIISQDEKDAFHNIFNSLPMAVIEVRDGKIASTRTNQPYRDFIKRFFNVRPAGEASGLAAMPFGSGVSFLDMVNRCCQNGNRAFIDDLAPDGSTIHTFVRRLAVNPVTGASAVVAVILSVTEPAEGANYADIARALAADYFNLFYVNLETEAFIEYTSEPDKESITMERRGENFFSEARLVANTRLVPEDREGFISVFTKENVAQVLDRQGIFSVNYRQYMGGEPVLVSMKIRRMHGNYIIIGVTSIDI
ncbi:MAG: EAL domain-containing protein [Clostridia bacterium]|nr:EAL domain-containing protein [Clostridia bacterium]